MKIRPALTVLAGTVALALSGCNLVGGSPDTADTGKVTVTVALVPDPPGASEFYRQQFDEFEKANPGIAVKVLENPTDQQLNAVELMFQQNNAPDVFRAQDDGMDRMAARGWVAPLDEFVTPDFLKRFPEGSMDPATSGLHRDGKLMSLPLVWGPWSTLRVFLYNEDLLKQSGFDGPPKTWGDLERIATKVTADGKGKYFGYAPTSAKAPSVEMLAGTAVPYSVPATGVDFRTGKPALSSPGLVEAVELHRRLQAAKVLMPGWESWDGSRAFKEFAAGRLAMYPTAPWHVAEVRKLAPELKLGVAGLPVPDAGRGAYLPLSKSFSPLWSMSAKSAHKAEGWKVMDFLASEGFHQAYYQKFGTLTALEGAWKSEAEKNPDQAALLKVAEETMRRAPNPSLASAGGRAMTEALAAEPDLKYTDAAVSSIIKNQPFAPAAAQLDKKLGSYLGQAATELKGKGQEGSAKDLTFAGWDPLKDYTPGG
ncbi:ABC-type glycerol-3-phosphate transport system substrate-binding protein [Kribbella amoyensis]|uniref:ABC-type glycerol-3-phosphate transport system substrate-binding protein n=1 Tax=Kribbella amoyensis TaxID=996641 RepID=A0A561BK97_9ACTN|nr:sugar ABC transporter substrate-binding protein [Kribbella amoyensis]TWD79308.1 ABC-type glycerol-3-phosphate transport system substrate-binding protein [Kribbella amoyensis]